jgi:hypothetical protein
VTCHVLEGRGFFLTGSEFVRSQATILVLGSTQTPPS